MTAITIDTFDWKAKFHPSLEAAEAAAAADTNLKLVTAVADLENMSGAELVSIYNKACDDINAAEGLGLQKTARFPNKQTAVKRVLANLSSLQEINKEAAPTTKAEKPVKAPKAVKPAREAAPADKMIQANFIRASTRTTKGINLKPLPKIYACRAGSKQAKLVDLLSRPEGATFDELHIAMNSDGFRPWAEVTTRSALGWDVHAVKGYGIRTEFMNGEQLAKSGRKVHAEVLAWDTSKNVGKDGYNPAMTVAVYHLVLLPNMKAPVPHTVANKEKVD